MATFEADDSRSWRHRRMVEGRLIEFDMGNEVRVQARTTAGAEKTAVPFGVA
jgi:hypothetical protein